jgi:hypothetical protein
MDFVDPFSSKTQTELSGHAGAGLIGSVVMDLHARDRRVRECSVGEQASSGRRDPWRRNRRAVQ